MSAGLDDLATIARVEPPAELDALVQSRYRAVALERWDEVRRCGASSQRSGRPRTRAVTALLAERCLYVLGLLAYGAQASAAQWVWHALTSGR